MTKPGTVRGQPLTLADKREIRRELVALSQHSGTRAFTYRYDGDDLREFRAWPSGKFVTSRCLPSGTSLEPPRRLLAFGVSHRVVGIAAAAGVLGLDLLSRLI